MFKRVSLIIIMLLSFLVGVASAVEVTCLDPADGTFIRGTGAPVTEIMTFPGVAGLATLKIYNGAADDTLERVSSSVISINGIDIATPDVFNQNVKYIEVQVHLVDGDNDLAVQLKSKPGGVVRVGVSQEVDAEAAAFIGPEGKIVKVKNPDSGLLGTSVEVFEGTFKNTEAISVSIQNNPPAVPLPEGVKQEGPCISFDSSNTNFLKPVLVKIPFREELQENEIRLVYTFNEKSNTWEIVPPVPSTNPNEFWALIPHFSDYIKGTATIDKDSIRTSFQFGRDTLRYRNNHDVGPDATFSCNFEDPKELGICAGIGLLATDYFNNYAEDENIGLSCRWDLLTSAQAACQAFGAYKLQVGLDVADIFSLFGERLLSMATIDPIEYSFMVNTIKKNLTNNIITPLVLESDGLYHFVIATGWKKTGLTSREITIYDVNHNYREGKINYTSVAGYVPSMYYTSPTGRTWRKFYFQDTLLKVDLSSVISNNPIIDNNVNGEGDSCESESLTLSTSEIFDEANNHDSVFSIISNLKNNSLATDKESYYPYLKDHANPDGFELQQDGSLLISYWLDSEWGDALGIDSSFNTVYSETPGPDNEGIFEVVSAGDEKGSLRGTQNPHAYYFSYDALNDGVGDAVSLTLWVDYLAAIRDKYQPIGRLTIFTHGNYGRIFLSNNIVLTLASVSDPNHEHYQQLKRLKDEGILSADAHILLFSCLVAGNSDGEALIRKIAELTGTYIHANSEYTGNASSGADLWAKYHIGDVGADWDLNIECSQSECINIATYSMLDLPVNGDTNIDPNYINFVWKPVQDIREYCLTIIEADNGNAIDFYCGLTTHAFQTTLQSGTTYSWRVDAIGEGGSTLESSQTRSFSTLPDEIDTDGDGHLDNEDAFPDDPTEWLDTDSDGAGDNSDLFPNDPNETIDSDGDGVGDNSDNCPNTPINVMVDASGCSLLPPNPGHYISISNLNIDSDYYGPRWSYQTFIPKSHNISGVELEGLYLGQWNYPYLTICKGDMSGPEPSDETAIDCGEGNTLVKFVSLPCQFWVENADTCDHGVSTAESSFVKSNIFFDPIPVTLGEKYFLRIFGGFSYSDHLRLSKSSTGGYDDGYLTYNWKGGDQGDLYFKIFTTPDPQTCSVEDTCNDGIDNNCDGQIDEGCFSFGTVTSLTGRVWMDRNLGASRVATSFDDPEAYGDLYQWGRLTDGHEKRNSPPTTTLSASDNPGHGSFILRSYNSQPNDWRIPQNDVLWQGVNGTNNPCPSGFRLPTLTEFETERTSWSSNNSAGAFASPLKFVVGGWRDPDDGMLYHAGSLGLYWSSTVFYSMFGDGNYSDLLYFNSSSANMNWDFNARGYSVRCIQE